MGVARVVAITPRLGEAMPARRWRRRERREGNVVIPALASALVLAVVGGPRTEPASGIVGGWQSPATRCEVMAGSLRIAPALHDVVADLCRRSPTFRRQV